MFGNLINNALIKELLSKGDIVINPYSGDLLQVAQYPLRAQILSEVISEDEQKQMHFFSERTPEFILKPKTYYCVDIFEVIRLPNPGIVGRFIPSSNLIEKGLGLTAGKIEKPFGDKGEKVRFGLYNYLNIPIAWKFTDRIAYVQFMDLRGLNNHKYKPTKHEERVYEFRLNEDNFPDYDKA